MMRRMRFFAALAALAALSGCTVGPKYRRPVVDVPGTFRNETNPLPSTASLGDEKWWTVFQDQELQTLIRTALQKNYDVQIAASRILQAQAQLGITRSSEFPAISADAGYSTEKIPSFGGFNFLQLQALVSWDIDFWGKYRRASEAARASLLADEWNRRQVISTMVENVASAYFQLRELDLELEIAQHTLASRQQSLKLTQMLFNGGAAAQLDVRQAEQLVETAAETIPDTERQIAQQEDLISTLLGENPQDIPRGRALVDQPLPATVPAGIPSHLLERRPDVRQAEERLVAANAEVGVAKAQFFPDLPLTASGGVESGALAHLLRASSSAWNVAAPVTQPVFSGGKLKSNLRLAQAEKQEAAITYRQAVQQAFRQVSDSLIANTKYREFREHQQLLTTAAQDAAHLSEQRYQGGVASYLEVLTNETNYFSAELNLARARLNERLSVVQLYNALGGGWD
jgi:multidrug efflux system outer membrane protein